MAMVLIQRVLRGYLFPLVFGQWDFSDPWQSNELLTIGL
jgi:hypothetical protein